MPPKITLTTALEIPLEIALHIALEIPLEIAMEIASEIDFEKTLAIAFLCCRTFQPLVLNLSSSFKQFCHGSRVDRLRLTK